MEDKSLLDWAWGCIEIAEQDRVASRQVAKHLLSDPRFVEQKVESFYTDYVFTCGYLRIQDHPSSPSSVSWQCSDSSNVSWFEQQASLLEVMLYNAYVNKQNEKTFMKDGYLTRIVERLPLRNKHGLLSEHVSDRRVELFRELATKYYSISSENEFHAWLEEFTVNVYTLVLIEPQFFRGDWEHECMMRVLPAGELSSAMALEYIDRYGILDNQEFKRRTNLAMEFFMGLLRAGNMNAFRLLERLVMKERVQPSHDVCFWFKVGFLRYYSGQRMFHQYVQDDDIQIGLQWEQICYHIARLLHGEIIEQPTLKNGKIPDILPNSPSVAWDGERVQHAPKLIECKKSELSYSPESIKKYFPYCDELEVWILETPSREPEPDVRFKRVYGRELADKIGSIDAVLAERILDMEKSASDFERDARFLRQNSNLEPDIEDQILALHAFFEPYYTSLNVR